MGSLALFTLYRRYQKDFGNDAPRCRGSMPLTGELNAGSGAGRISALPSQYDAFLNLADALFLNAQHDNEISMLPLSGRLPEPSS